jgi:hypothetical protein
MRAAALGVGAHLRRRLDRHDARVKGLGEQHREAPGVGAEVEDRQVVTRGVDVAGGASIQSRPVSAERLRPARYAW